MRHGTRYVLLGGPVHPACENQQCTGPAALLGPLLAECTSFSVDFQQLLAYYIRSRIAATYARLRQSFWLTY